jgi:hypothetical protein
MGKESKLRGSTQPAAKEYPTYANGDRKLAEKENKCPAGCDEYIWNLALYFEQCMQPYGVSWAKTPVVYTELYEAVQSDPDLTCLLDAGTIYTSGKGEGGKALVTSATKASSKEQLVSSMNKYKLVELVIQEYFASYSSNTAPDITSFILAFTDIKASIIHKEYLKYLVTNGTRVPQKLPERQPDRRPSWKQAAVDMALGNWDTDAHHGEHIAKWKSRKHPEGDLTD